MVIIIGLMDRIYGVYSGKIWAWVYSLHDVRPPTRQRKARSNENIAAVKASLIDRPNLLNPRHSQELGLSQTTTWQILQLYLGTHPYKMVLTQQLKPQDYLKCREFADWALEQLAADADLGWKIIFYVEAHFWLNGYVNKQNCRYSSESSLQVFEELPFHPQRLTVWCGLWHGSIIGPYFFWNKKGRAVIQFSVSAVGRYWTDVIPIRCHYSNETIDVLKEKFGDWIISRSPNERAQNMSIVQ